MKNNKLRMVFQSRSTWAWPYALFMLCLVILPLVLIGVYAFTDADGSFTIQNFVSFFTKSEAINTFIYSLAIALITTIICLLLGYPAAYIMAMADFKTPQVMAMLFILPMWINFLLRTIATVELFRMFGLPLGEGALLFGMVYDFLPNSNAPSPSGKPNIRNNSTVAIVRNRKLIHIGRINNIAITCGVLKSAIAMIYAAG